MWEQIIELLQDLSDSIGSEPIADRLSFGGPHLSDLMDGINTSLFVAKQFQNFSVFEGLPLMTDLESIASLWTCVGYIKPVLKPFDHILTYSPTRCLLSVRWDHRLAQNFCDK